MYLNLKIFPYQPYVILHPLLSLCLFLYPSISSSPSMSLSPISYISISLYIIGRVYMILSVRQWVSLSQFSKRRISYTSMLLSEHLLPIASISSLVSRSSSSPIFHLFSQPLTNQLKLKVLSKSWD